MMSPAESDHELGVAIVGYGLAGSVFHGPLVVATPGLRVTAVVTNNEARADQARADHPGARVFAGVGDLLADARDVDLVVVASPNRTHASIALAAIEAGTPVVVDKPFAVTSEEAQQVVDAAAARGVPLSVFQNRRWDGDFLTLRRLLDEGVLGEVTRFESRFERWRPMPKGGWRENADPAEAGGLLFDLGAHLIDQALVAFGGVTQVYAEVDRRRDPVAADDDVFVALTHANGVRTHLWCSAVASELGPRLRVLGSRAGYVKYGLDGQEDALRGGGRPDVDPAWGQEPEARWGSLGTVGEMSPVATEPGAYQHFYAAVALALRGRGDLPVDPRDSVEVLRIIEAAHRSSQRRQVVAHS
jgi:scyllo-inositol 2-dehydrogenase (NADP+)